MNPLILLLLMGGRGAGGLLSTRNLLLIMMMGGFGALGLGSLSS